MSSGNQASSVMAYLQRAAQAPRGVSPLDAVMGENWAEYEAGNPRKAMQVQYLMRQQRNRRAAGAGLSFRVGNQSNQAMVKLITKGGAKNAQGLRAQMDYLQKDGTVTLQRSERYFGAEVDDEQRDLMSTAWGMKEGANTGYARTSHFVVSFPIGTDPEAAARAGRAWAVEMFESGRLGDKYDYYTADHRDTAHPHTHVVVSRRGLENGDWLKASRRSELNYDTMRALQVEVAAAEGIILEATPRLARGVHERPVPDAQVRAQREGRASEASSPEHTEVTAIATAATLIDFSDQFEAERNLLGDAPPAVEALFDQLVGALRSGHQITARQQRNPADMKEWNAMAEQFEARRTEITDSFKAMDREISEVPDPEKRVALQRKTAELKREAAQLMPDNAELQSYRFQDAEDDYQGLRGSGGGPEADAVREQAQREVERIAKDAGLNADEVRARYGSEEVSQGLSREWREKDLAERARSRAEAGQGHETAEQAREAVDGAHRKIDDTFRAAEGRLAGMGVSISEEQREQSSRPAEQDRRASDVEQVRAADDEALRARQERERRGRVGKAEDRGRDRDDDGYGL